MVYNSAEQNCCTAALNISVTTVTNIVSKLEGLLWGEMGLYEEENVDIMMPQKVFQIQLPAPDAVSVPACHPQGCPFRPSRRGAIFGSEKDDGLQEGSG
jgi:hypothetical protein